MSLLLLKERIPSNLPNLRLPAVCNLGISNMIKSIYVQISQILLGFDCSPLRIAPDTPVKIGILFCFMLIMYLSQHSHLIPI